MTYDHWTVTEQDSLLNEIEAGIMREFKTGATRNQDATQPDYEGFLSPLTILAFGRYMNKHRLQADGKLRDSDNWQKGIPLTSYVKSLLRHVLDLWLHHRGYSQLARESVEEALGGIMFNVNGYTHELEKTKLPSYSGPKRVEAGALQGAREQMDPVEYQPGAIGQYNPGEKK